MTDTPSFQMSADARLIYQRLKKVQIGETIKFAELSAEVSRPLHLIRGAIGTALRRCLKDDGMVFANVRSVGYQRCNDEAIIDGSVQATSRIRRTARRAAEKLTKVRDYAALPGPRQLEHTARLSVLSAVASLTQESAIKKVEGAAHGRSQELPIAETMKAFLGENR